MSGRLVALLGFLCLPLAAGPPAGQWDLIFADEFDGSKLDESVWQSQAGPSGHILSSRWPENAVVENGLLRLLTRQEQRGGQQWTSGNVWTRTRRFGYGYFEARYRYGAAPGLNNAFWLWKELPGRPAGLTEIDINEGHYPNEIIMTLHLHNDGAGKRHLGISQVHEVDGADLSREFHVYGCLWRPGELTFYFDDQVVGKLPNPVAVGGGMKLLFSSAVASFAGQVDQALHGTAMEVDWVRVYEGQPAPPEPPTPAPQPEAGSLLCREDFESTAAGALPPAWVAVRGQPAVAPAEGIAGGRLVSNGELAWHEEAEVPAGEARGQRYLLLRNASDAAYLPFPSQRQRFAVEFDLLTAAPWSEALLVVTGPAFSPTTPAGRSGEWPWVAGAGPYLSWQPWDLVHYFDGRHWRLLDRLAEEGWQRLRLLVDPAASSFELASGARLVGRGIFRAPQTELNGLLVAGRANRHDFRPVGLDNIVITALEP